MHMKQILQVMGAVAGIGGLALGGKGRERRRVEVGR